MDERQFKLSGYDYPLPRELIAPRPERKRHRSKLLVYDGVRTVHSNFLELARFLPTDATLVLNDSKVLPARLVGHKKTTGGKVEILAIGTALEQTQCPALLKCSGKTPPGTQILLPSGLEAKVGHRRGEGFDLSFNAPLGEVFEAAGRAPLPPYIRGGEADERDASDYQTLFAKHAGSLAAPTAGLHFDLQVFDKLASRGISTAFVTLHVGPGTFLPVRGEDIRTHRMHPEEFFIDEENAEKIRRARRLFAVGTTSLRVLESLYVPGRGIDVVAGRRYTTDIFIRPGKTVRSVAGLVTNFHLPRSSLLILVASLLGRRRTLRLYAEAVRRGYRFYSYGDAMLVLLDGSKP